MGSIRTYPVVGAERTYSTQPSAGAQQKQFPCHICPKSFTRGASLRDHLAVHRDERDFVCGQCNRAFTRKNDLKAHMTKHSGERRYACERCGRRFARQFSFKRHTDKARRCRNGPVAGRPRDLQNDTERTPEDFGTIHEFQRREPSNLAISMNYGWTDVDWPLQLPDPRADKTLEAIRDLPTLKTLLDRGVYSPDWYNQTLIIAVEEDATHVVSFLLENVPSIDLWATRGYSKGTALHSAVNNIEILKVLLDAKAPVDMKDISGRTPLAWALRLGLRRDPNSRVASMLLDYGADVNITDNLGQSILHVAVEHCQHKPTLERIIRSTAYINQGDNYGEAPIHTAAATFCESLVALLRAGADVHARDEMGRTALHQASESGRDASVEKLLEAGADVHAEDEEKRTALHYASASCDEACIETLLEAGAAVTSKDAFGQTPLHAVGGFVHDVEPKDEFGCPGKDLDGGPSRFEDSVELLLNHSDIDIDAVDEFGNSAMMTFLYACEPSMDRAISKFFAHDANVNLINKRNMTALDIAIQTYRACSNQIENVPENEEDLVSSFFAMEDVVYTISHLLDFGAKKASTLQASSDSELEL